MNVELKTTTVVTRDYTIRLNGKAIISMLRQELKARGASESLPPDTVQVEFNVPGGGDYSNCTLNVDDDYPVTIHWSEKSGEHS